MKNKLLLLAAVPAFALAGCGVLKCEYEDFKEAAEKTMEKAPEIAEATYKGEYDGKKFDFTKNYASAGGLLDSLLDTDATQIAVLAIASPFSSVKTAAAAYSVKSDDVTFYKLPGYSIKDGEVRIDFNMKGYLSKIDGSKQKTAYKFTVTYKYAD